MVKLFADAYILQGNFTVMLAYTSFFTCSALYKSNVQVQYDHDTNIHSIICSCSTPIVGI